MASLASSFSSLKPPPINLSSHKLLGFNLSTQLTLKLSPPHQPFSTTRSSKNLTTTAAYSPRRKIKIHEDKNFKTSSEDENVNTRAVYAIKLLEPGDGGVLKKLINLGKDHVSFVCVLPPEKNDGNGGDSWHEDLCNFHFGKHGYVSVQGTSEETEMNVIGGSGSFKGVQGKVKLQKIEFPVKQFYTFYLEGIKNLPDKL